MTRICLASLAAGALASLLGIPLACPNQEEYSLFVCTPGNLWVRIISNEQ